MSGRPRRELLTIDVDATGTSVRATISGELDENTAPQLISTLEHSIEASRDLAIDAAGLTFCGSAGLSALIVLDRSVTAAGGSLTVERPSLFLSHILEIAGLDGLIADEPRT